MLYWLLYLELYRYFPPFRIFRYLTFRTAFASMTALFTGQGIAGFLHKPFTPAELRSKLQQVLEK